MDIVSLVCILFLFLKIIEFVQFRVILIFAILKK